MHRNKLHVVFIFKWKSDANTTPPVGVRTTTFCCGISRLQNNTTLLSYAKNRIKVTQPPEQLAWRHHRACTLNQRMAQA
jgi:hypothetical protein